MFIDTRRNLTFLYKLEYRFLSIDPRLMIRVSGVHYFNNIDKVKEYIRSLEKQGTVTDINLYIHDEYTEEPRLVWLDI